MKVLQINAVYGQGSTGTIVRDIEHLCEQSGIECYVASPDSKVREAKRGYVIGNILDHKIHAILSRIHGKQAYYSHIPTRNLIRWIDEIKPEIVHLHNLHSNYIHLNMLLHYLAEKDIKTIVTLHDCWFLTGGCFYYTATDCNKWLTNCMNCPKHDRGTPALFSKQSAKILADRKKFLLAIPHLYITGVSEWVAHEALKTFLKNTPNYVITNGIDMEIFKPTPSDLRKRLGLEGKYIILGPASKWLQHINKHILVELSNIMQPDEVLLLFGVTNTIDFLPENIKTYGYTKNREELAKLYTMADVFANVTREDALSLINVEVQACGTPVVTFNQTGPKETVDDINSFSVPVGDANKMYETIRYIRNHRNDDTSKKCRLFIKDKFNLNNTYQLYINLYKNICNI